MKRILTLIFVAFCLLQSTEAQVAKKVIVEHFTNTNCGICGNRNPGFYKNLKNFPEVLHMSVHPSSPYASCKLSQQANPDNDARTNYYGIYGGTPRLVVQGVVVSANADYNSGNLFTPYLNATSPLSIKIEQTQMGIDSVHAKITITAEAANTQPTLRLFAALAEDTVFYKGNNSETQHYDVFRASFFGATGTTVNVPTVKGESVVYEATVASKNIWNLSRIYTIAILQNVSSKEVVQAEAIAPEDSKTTSVNNTLSESVCTIAPNPASEFLNVSLQNNQPANLKLMNLDGRVVYSVKFIGNTQVSLTSLAKGIYIAEVSTSLGKLSKKVVVE